MVLGLVTRCRLDYSTRPREASMQRPRIGSRCYIAPTGSVIGDVVMGDDSSVWFSAVVRGDAPIRIGDRTNIQDNCTVHSDIRTPTKIGNGVSIGHNAVVHGCTIEDDSLIGMNSTILNGAVIGRGSLIAAGAVVKENTIVPPFSLVAGIPARVVKQDPELLQRCKQNAVAYLKLKEAYLRGDFVIVHGPAKL